MTSQPVVTRLYIHIPWCRSLCSYCSFYSEAVNSAAQLDLTVQLLCRELALQTEALQLNAPLQSIYFGGGTPSLLSPKQLEQLLHAAQNRFGLAQPCEITLEANPGTVSRETLSDYRQLGVTRISLGIQSFDDQTLQLLGRCHTSSEGHRAYADARSAGFPSVSIDLMAGLPGSLPLWQETLQQALALAPDHISLYGLSLDPDTPLARQVDQGLLTLPDDDQVADLLETAARQFETAGLQWYEIANFARDGHQSRHNSGYWLRDGYLGLGPAAHSFLKQGAGVRFANPASFDRWRSGIEAGCLVQEEHQRLTAQQARSETVFLGLRLAAGIDLSLLDHQFGGDFAREHHHAIARCQQAGLLTHTGERLMLTNQGRLMANQVLSLFI